MASVTSVAMRAAVESARGLEEWEEKGVEGVMGDMVPARLRALLERGPSAGLMV